MSELLPCPFCGGEVRTFNGYLWHVVCDRCGCKLTGFATEAEAIAAWNNRAKPPCGGGYCPLCGVIERTCEFNIKDNMNETDGMGDVWIECSTCHCVFDFYADEWLMKMNYCPNCGCKAVGE